MKGKEPQGDYIYPVYSNGIGDNAIWGYANTYKFDKPAITFSSIGTIGHPEIRTTKFTPIIRLKVIIPKDERVDLRYLKYALEVVDFGLNKSSVPNINANMIKNIKVPLISKDEQKRVANICHSF